MSDQPFGQLFVDSVYRMIFQCLFMGTVDNSERDALFAGGDGLFSKNIKNAKLFHQSLLLIFYKCQQAAGLDVLVDNDGHVSRRGRISGISGELSANH